MPRTGPRRSLTTAAALLAMLAAPAAAEAASYTVKAGDGPCGAADTACGGLAEAAAAAAPGDIFNVSPGTYGSATFTVGGVTIAGTAAGVAVNGALTFSGASGGVSKLKTVGINATAGPAVSVTGAAGLEISDSLILAGAGDGVQFHAGAANKIMRALIATGGTNTAAVRVLSADNSPTLKGLTLESVLLTGSAAGLSVNTGNGGLISSAPGHVLVALRHVTAAGSANGIVLNASQANPLTGGPYGNITADVTDSIIQNGTAKLNYAGLGGILGITAPANVVTDTYTRTLREFDPVAVFQDPARARYRLKAGSPAINAGGVTPGESPTDIDGNDRSAAPTDLGFDEYTVPAATPPPAVTPPPAPGSAGGDGTAPAIVITKPKANQKIKLVTTTTKTVTVTRDGKQVKVKRKTTKRTKIGFAGTAKDASGIRGVILTIEKLSETGKSGSGTPTAATTKCRWFNATKGLVLKSCAKPILLLAKMGANGAWTFNPKSTIRFSAGQYRVLVAGVDNSGARGNSAPRGDAIHRFTLLKK